MKYLVFWCIISCVGNSEAWFWESNNIEQTGIINSVVENTKKDNPQLLDIQIKSIIGLLVDLVNITTCVLLVLIILTSLTLFIVIKRKFKSVVSKRAQLVGRSQATSAI